MKIFLLIFLLSPLGFSVERMEKKYEYSSFQEAKDSPSQLQFLVESTKVGIFSSDVEGQIKNFQTKADYDPENKIYRNIQVRFPVASMDTDHADRDEKLHQQVMGLNVYPQVEIEIPGPLFVSSARASTIEGTVKVRGKIHPFKIEFIATEGEGKIILEGKTVWSLKALELPDPSIAIAKLSDEIRVQIKLVLE